MCLLSFCMTFLVPEKNINWSNQIFFEIDLVFRVSFKNKKFGQDYFFLYFIVFWSQWGECPLKFFVDSAFNCMSISRNTSLLYHCFVAPTCRMHPTLSSPPPTPWWPPPGYPREAIKSCCHTGMQLIHKQSIFSSLFSFSEVHSHSLR